MSWKLTGVVIARNEEEHIGRCLRSLAWASARLVVDSESTDRTREIARAEGAEVVVQPWLGVGRQYQFAVSRAPTDWVLVVDADEVVSPELAREIENLLASCPASPAYDMPRLNFALGRWLRYGGWTERVTRLFRRDRARFRPLNHPRLEVDGTTGRLENPIRHYMATDFVAWWRRSLALARIEAETAFREGRRFSGRRLAGGYWKFLRRYLFKLGFLHGWAGLFCCFQRFLYVAAREACLLELQRGVRSPAGEPHRRHFK